jgi:hypothetical protein
MFHNAYEQSPFQNKPYITLILLFSKVYIDRYLNFLIIFSRRRFSKLAKHPQIMISGSNKQRLRVCTPRQ